MSSGINWGFRFSRYIRSKCAPVRRFFRRIRQDGVQAVPRMVYSRCVARRYRAALAAEAAVRQAADTAYPAWLHRHERPLAIPLQTSLRLSFLIPTWNTRPEHLAALAESLLAQSCPSWEACFCDGASTDPMTRQALSILPERDVRFRVLFLDRNDGISGNTNTAFTMATGDVIALCDHDDLLAPDAVRCILQAAEGGADFIYTDEDKVSEDGTRFYDPHLKPDFAPDSLRAGNYICHITAMTRAVAQTLVARDGSLLRPGFDGSQDHDLALRAAEVARQIVHIPRILYHWRMLDTSFSHQRAERCAQAACAAVRDQLRRLNIPATVRMENLRVRIRYEVPEASVTAIVLGNGRIPALPGEVLRVHSAAQLNGAARHATGEYLLFLHGGMKPLDRDWLKELLMHASRPGVGCVGSAIIDQQRFYRHAGYAVDVPGGAVSHHTGQHLHGRPYMITDRLVRNVTGVSSSLLLIRRETFLQLGGFGAYESDLRGADLGLRCLAASFVNVYTPHSRMLCRGTLPCLTGPAPEADILRFQQAWGEHPPEFYYSPLFARDGAMTIDFTREGR